MQLAHRHGHLTMLLLMRPQHHLLSHTRMHFTISSSLYILQYPNILGNFNAVTSSNHLEFKSVVGNYGSTVNDNLTHILSFCAVYHKTEPASKFSSEYWCWGLHPETWCLGQHSWKLEIITAPPRTWGWSYYTLKEHRPEQVPMKFLKVAAATEV